MKTQNKSVLASILAISIAAAASAQQAPTAPPTTPYGAPIGLEAAKKVIAAAEAEATKNNWGMGHRHPRQHRPYRDAAQA
jgi:glc operon protein GlcG